MFLFFFLLKEILILQFHSAIPGQHISLDYRLERLRDSTFSRTQNRTVASETVQNLSRTYSARIIVSGISLFIYNAVP